MATTADMARTGCFDEQRRQDWVEKEHGEETLEETRGLLLAVEETAGSVACP